MFSCSLNNFYYRLTVEVYIHMAAWTSQKEEIKTGVIDFNNIMIELPPDREQALSDLIQHIKTVMHTYERNNSQSVKAFYIGKSSVPESQNFDIRNPKGTWRTSRIQSRWREHKTKGYAAMVVIAVVTEDTLPIGVGKAQSYCLSLESGLINKFQFDSSIKDKRITNGGSDAGRKANEADTIAYVLYIAMALQHLSEYSKPEKNLKSCPKKEGDTKSSKKKNCGECSGCLSSKSLPSKKPEDRNGKPSLGAREHPHTREESEVEINNSEGFQNKSSRSSHDQRMISKSVLMKKPQNQNKTSIGASEQPHTRKIEGQGSSADTIEPLQMFKRQETNHREDQLPVSMLPEHKDIQHTQAFSSRKTKGSWTDPQSQDKPHNTKMAGTHHHKREVKQDQLLKATAQSYPHSVKEPLPQPSTLEQKSSTQLSHLQLSPIEILKKSEIMNIEKLAQWFDKLSFEEQNEVIKLYQRRKPDVYSKLIARSKTRTKL